MSSSRDVGYENNNIRGEINQINNNNNNRYKKLIKLTAVIAGKPALILVDCGSSGNFVSKAFLEKNGISSSSSVESMSVSLADGTDCDASSVLNSVDVSIGGYKDNIDFVVMQLKGYDAILGMPWLDKYNPKIDFRNRKLDIEIEGKVVSLHCARSFDNKSKSLYLSRKRSRTEFANLNLISHKQVKSMSKNNIEC